MVRFSFGGYMDMISRVQVDQSGFLHLLHLVYRSLGVYRLYFSVSSYLVRDLMRVRILIVVRASYMSTILSMGPYVVFRESGRRLQVLYGVEVSYGSILNRAGICPIELGVGLSLPLLRGRSVYYRFNSYVIFGYDVQGSCYSRGLYPFDRVLSSDEVYLVGYSLYDGCDGRTSQSCLIGYFYGRMVISARIVLIML